MKPKRIKKIFKIFGLILLVVFSVLLIVLINFISPKTDREVMSRFKEAEVQPHLSYEYFKGREVRLTYFGFCSRLPRFFNGFSALSERFCT